MSISTRKILRGKLNEVIAQQQRYQLRRNQGKKIICLFERSPY
ncbi:MAG: hypothetical protein V7K86_12445 [Nostoc sp.]